MLTSSQDLVVRLAAAKAMKVVIDDFEFSVEELEPYLEQVFSLLFSLLKEVNECDTKLNVLNVLSYLIERVGVSIRPICSALLHYLPTLWEESASHNMLRCSILSTLVFIVQGLGTVSEGLLPFLGPVLELSIDIAQVELRVIFLYSTNTEVQIFQDSHIYLLEDGLELWLTLLHNTAQPYDTLLHLLTKLPPLLTIGSENLRTTIYILQAYVLLCPLRVMETIGPVVVRELSSQYSDLQDEASTLSSLLLSSIKKSLKMIFLQRMLSEERSSHRRQLCPALAISWRECHESQSMIICHLTFESRKKNILRRSSSGRNSQVPFVFIMISQRRSVLRSCDQS